MAKKPAPTAGTPASGRVKVRLLVSRVGAGLVQNRGDEIEVSASEAESIIAAGHAEAV